MLYVGYYTQGTPYEAEARNLHTNLESFGLEHEIISIANRGSWQKNTQAKAEVIRDFLIRFPSRPFVYLDVDAEVVKPPVLFDNLGCDIAAAKFRGTEVLSGTLFISGNERCRAIIEKWIALCTEYPDFFPGRLLPHYRNKVQEFAWDQRILDIAIRGMPEVKFEVLPPEYTWIFDMSPKWYPGVEPVIVHHAASRKYRSFFDGSKTN